MTKTQVLGDPSANITNPEKLAKMADDMANDIVVALNAKLLEAQKQGIMGDDLVSLNITIGARFAGTLLGSSMWHADDGERILQTVLVIIENHAKAAFMTMCEEKGPPDCNLQ